MMWCPTKNISYLWQQKTTWQIWDQMGGLGCIGGVEPYKCCLNNFLEEKNIHVYIYIYPGSPWPPFFIGWVYHHPKGVSPLFKWWQRLPGYIHIYLDPQAGALLRGG